MRLAAASAFAAIALTACNPTGGETTIESTSPAVEPATVVVPTSVPVETEGEAGVLQPIVEAAEETAEETEALVEVESVTVVDAAPGDLSDESEEPTGDETDVDTTADLEPGVYVDEPQPVEDAADTDGTEATTDAEEAPETTETAAFEITEANCLDGRWIAAPGEIELYFATIGLANGIEMNGSGHLIIVLENGNYVYDARIVNQINVDGFPTTSVVDGVTQGNYTYENGFIVANETAGSLDAYVDLGGTRIDASDLGEDFAQMGAFHEAPYDCNGDNPSIHFDVAPGVARYEMKFIPWDGTRP